MFENAHFINMAFDPAVPYNDLPLLPPKLHAGDVENTAVLKECIQARAALAELNQLCVHFPNQPMLWKNFSLLEAQSNCELDGHAVAVDTLFKIPADNSLCDDDTARVMATRKALTLGYELTREKGLNVSVLLELCSAIERSPMPVRRVSTHTVQASTADGSTAQVVYTPPVGAELIQRLLGNWERFIHVDAGSLDPLVLLAIAHYQLEAIQPFSSSNGTVARLVDYLLLAEENLLTVPVLNLSHWYQKNRQEYVLLLSLVTQQQHWHEWIQFVVKGIATTARNASAKLRAIVELIAHTDAFVAAKLPKIHSPMLIDVMFTEPYVRIQHLVERGIARRQTASVYLKNLCDIGVLHEVPYGKEKLFVHQKLLRLLTDDSHQFAQYVQ